MVGLFNNKLPYRTGPLTEVTKNENRYRLGRQVRYQDGTGFLLLQHWLLFSFSFLFIDLKTKIVAHQISKQPPAAYLSLVRIEIQLFYQKKCTQNNNWNSIILSGKIVHSMRIGTQKLFKNLDCKTEKEFLLIIHE